MKEESFWQYNTEQYPPGTPLWLLTLDDQALWASGGASIPTFAWIAEQQSVVFDTLWSNYDDPIWGFRAFYSNHADNHYSLVSQHFDLKLFALGNASAEMLYPQAELQLQSNFPSYIKMYEYFRDELGLSLGSTAVIVPALHELDQPIQCNQNLIPGIEYDCSIPITKDDISKDFPIWKGHSHKEERQKLYFGRRRKPGFFSRFQFYLWPEIFFRKALGFTDDISIETLRAFGIKKVCLCHVDPVPYRQAGFEVEIIDTTNPSDRAWDISTRILQRWKNQVKGLAYGIWQSDKMNPGWLGYLIRNRVFIVYDADWLQYIPRLRELAEEVKIKMIHGTGDSWNHGHFYMNSTLGLGWLWLPTEAGILSVKRGIVHKTSPPQHTPWTEVYTDEELEAFAEQKKIAVTHTFGTTDFAYVPGFYNLLDLCVYFRIRCAFGVYYQIVEYLPEYYQKFFTKHFGRYVEPMVHQFPVAMMWPNDSFLPNTSSQAFAYQLELFKDLICNRLGHEYLPHGYLGGFFEGQDWRNLFRDKSAGQKCVVTGETIDQLATVIQASPETLATYDPDKQQARNRKKVQIVRSSGFDYYLGNIEERKETDFVSMKFTHNFLEPLADELKGPGWMIYNWDFGGRFNICSGFRAGNQGGHWPEGPLPGAVAQLRELSTGGPDGRFVSMKPSELLRYRRIVAPEK